MTRSFILVDSKDKINPADSSSNFEVCFLDLLDSETNKDISIESVIIPNSHYSVNNSNNTFLVNGTDTVTLTNGNYTVVQYIAMLDNRIAADTALTTTSTYSNITGKLTITGNTDFTITSNNYNYAILGMDRGTTVASSSNAWVSPNVLDLSGTRYVDLILASETLSSTNSTNNNRNVLGRVWLNAPAFEVVYYTSEAFNKIALGNNRFQSARILLVDENNSQIDLNGLDWSMTLHITSQEPIAK